MFIPTIVVSMPVPCCLCYWIYNIISAKVQQCLFAVLSAGPVPRHIAFILDGNRRYAKKIKDNEDQYGHKAGFDAICRMLSMCFHMNFYCITVYAFSIENFKRSAEEVDAYMTFIVEKFSELGHPGGLLDTYGVRLNVIGRVELLPQKVQCVVRQMERATRHNNKAIFNIYAPYTSSDEMTMAIESCVKDGLAQDEVDPDKHFTTEEIDKRLMSTTRGCPRLDVLVRTSGVKRLSDFMLWQSCADTQIQFLHKLWPEFSAWDLILIILDYQRKAFGKQVAV